MTKSVKIESDTTIYIPENTDLKEQPDGTYILDTSKLIQAVYILSLKNGAHYIYHSTHFSQDKAIESAKTDTEYHDAIISKITPDGTEIIYTQKEG